MTIDFTAVGSMDGGAVRLVIPDDWGNLQDDDATLANYVEVDVAPKGADQRPLTSPTVRSLPI